MSQGQELAWQRGVEGDNTKITHFQEMIGALKEFKTYLFMKTGSFLHDNSFTNEVHGT
jgi:hypothetical protein